MSKSAATPSPTTRPDAKRSGTQQPIKNNVNSKNNSKNKDRSAARAGRGPGRTRTGTDGRGQRSGRATGTVPSNRFRSRHPILVALVPVVLVVAAVVTMVVVKAAGNSGQSPSASQLHAAGPGAAADPGTTPLSSSILASLSVPASTLDAVGTSASVIPPSRVSGGGGVLRSADGKPEITYVGAEYCPYCAAERWALAVALSRFGTFSNLSGTHSASDDVYPNTQTLSFYGSSYSSAYVDFQAVEEATNQQAGGTYQSLQSPTAAQSALLAAYDPQGSIPFVDIGNRYVITGASYSPQLLQGLSRAQIAAQLSDPSSSVAQAIDGTANYITAAITAVTGNQPSSVSSSPVIAQIAKTLGA